jgi:hypothetical protein
MTGQHIDIVILQKKKRKGKMTMIRAKLGERTKWLACILMAFSLTLFVSHNLFAEEYGLGDIPLPQEVYQKHLKVRADKFVLLDAAPPASYDARDYGIVTSAKDQAYCGSCWAFASVGAMESHLLKTFGFGPSDLSEQQQVSCNGSMSGCCGGNLTASRYWENKGPIYESCFPYGDSDFGTSCPPNSGVDCSGSAECEELVYRVVNWHTVDATPAGFKTSLYEDGPNYWRFAVYSDFNDFWNYGNWGEVYYQTYGTYRGGHAVLLIGWDDNKGAYLCKNSWGTNAGPNNDGTFWIAYSEHAHNLGFGMSNFSVIAVGGCGDGTCDEGEDSCVCPEDCGSHPISEDPLTTCDDGVDNDCDGYADCDDTDCEEVPACRCGNGKCELGEDCNTCPDDCIGGSGEADCGNGVCEPAAGEDCISCPNDCAGKQTGKPSKRFCCGDGDGISPVDCGDPRCKTEEYSCGQTPEPFCCGDLVCEGAEDQCNCAIDCGDPPTNEIPGTGGTCNDGTDNDCDGLTDCDDSDCSADPACVSDCGERDAPCTVDEDCCSDRCHRGKCK